MQKKIRVLHILDELNTGGAEKIVVNYFQNIDRDKFQWDFVITQYADPNKRGLLENTVEELGGKIYRVPRKKENYIKNISETKKIIQKGKYDIVHSHLDELSAFYLIAARKAKVPVRICHSHLAGAERGKAIEVICKMLRPMMISNTTDKFACGIEAGKALWGKKAVTDGDVHIMKNAIRTDLFRFDNDVRNRKRAELRIEDRFVLGTVGRLTKQKNSLFLIDILQEIIKSKPNAIMMIVGEGDLLNLMKEKIKEKGLQKAVLFLGSRYDVNELMMAMDVFLLPSIFEGLPIVLIEAQCSGLPCCVSDMVTKEIQINDNLKYTSIDSVDGWDRYVMNSTISNRDSGYWKIRQQGYEIKDAAKNLQEYYIKAVKR